MRRPPTWVLVWLLAGTILAMQQAEIHALRKQVARQWALEARMDDIEGALGHGITEMKRATSGLTRALLNYLGKGVHYDGSQEAESDNQGAGPGTGALPRPGPDKVRRGQPVP